MANGDEAIFTILLPAKELAMELDPRQYGVLRTYQRWRGKPPTYGSLIRANLRPLGVMAFVCGAAAVFCHLIHLTAFSLLFVGFWCGQLVAEIARIRTVPVVWSVLIHVLDWSRVQQAVSTRRFD